MQRIKAKLEEWIGPSGGDWAQSPLLFVLTVILAARLIALALAFLLWRCDLIPPQLPSPGRTYPRVDLAQGPVSSWTLGVWQRLDTLHYLHIARYGYGAGGRIVVFPPLYPLLIRAVGEVLGGRYVLGALLVSTAACVGALLLLYRITAAEFGRHSARRAVAYLMFFPTGYILIGGYAESLMLFLMLLAFQWARKDRWWLSALAAFLATLARLQAVMLVLPLAYLYLRRAAREERLLRWDVLALAGAPLALLGYNAYLAWRGLPSVPQAFREYWGSTVAVPGMDLVLALRLFLTGAINFQRALALALTVLFLVLTILAFRHLAPEYGLYMLGSLLYTLSRHELGGRALLSVSRHVLILFPGFMLLGNAGRRPWVHRLILYVSFGLHLFLMGVFFMGGYAE